MNILVSWCTYARFSWVYTLAWNYWVIGYMKVQLYEIILNLKTFVVIFSQRQCLRCYLIHLFSVICYHRTSTFANQMGVKCGLDLYFLYYLWGWIPYRPCVLSPLWTAYSWLSPVFLPGLLPYTGLQDRSSLHTFNNDPLLAICVSNIFPSLWLVFSWFINVPHFKAVKFINLSRLMAFVT